MAISATFAADFTSFLGEADKAQQKLKGLKEDASAVGPALDRAVGTAPTAFTQLGTAAQGTSGFVKELSTSVDAVDRTLGAAGISLGPLPGALKELGSAATVGATGLGTFSTALLGAAAAAAGWNVGRWVAQWAGTDEKIGNATAALLGWGDVAKEEAAAAAETLGRASEIAGRQITSLKEAIDIMTKATFVPYTTQLENARNETGKLDAATRAQVDAGIALGKSTEEIGKQYGISQGALRVYTDQTQAQEKADRAAQDAAKQHAAEMKKQHDALIEVQTASRGYSEVLTTIEPKTQTAIRLALENGVAQGTLATAYGLTDGQIRAVATALDVERKAADDSIAKHQDWAKKVVEASQTAGKLWGEYHELVVAQGGTAVDQQIAQIDRWKLETIDAMKAAGTYNAETYTAVEAVAAAKLEAVRVDWDYVSKGSRQALEDTAAKAAATYDYVSTHSDQFTEQQIADRLREKEATQKAVDEWGNTYHTTLDGIGAHSEQTARRVVGSFSEAMAAVGRGEGTMGGTISGPPTASYDQVARAFAEGRYYGPVTGGQNDAFGHAIPGTYAPDYAALGLSPTGPGGAANVTVNVAGNVLGTQDQLARLVGDAVVGRLRQQGVRLPTGV